MIVLSIVLCVFYRDELQDVLHHAAVDDCVGASLLYSDYESDHG